MKIYKMTESEIKINYDFDEDFTLIGHVSINVPVYVCSINYSILVRHQGWNNYDIYEFSLDEARCDFEDFAVNYCLKNIPDFYSIRDINLKRAQNTHESILEFMQKAKYGENKHFDDSRGNTFFVIRIPGGYIFQGSVFTNAVFVPYEI